MSSPAARILSIFLARSDPAFNGSPEEIDLERNECAPRAVRVVPYISTVAQVGVFPYIYMAP
jgi:hypothetical protein